ncbi:hypothetical protein TSUD_380290 [Trifolium subterraneum]|uniref:Uncharacterized protein n=1 Tax=Trifolium subterraneum TaxID=3900 RepID=A0A2Z6PE56_TRISU|nr:hypothetical protein TSUD_380290 [Trifolium subterraneum]
MSFCLFPVPLLVVHGFALWQEVLVEGYLLVGGLVWNHILTGLLKGSKGVESERRFFVTCYLIFNARYIVFRWLEWELVMPPELFARRNPSCVCSYPSVAYAKKSSPSMGSTDPSSSSLLVNSRVS